MSIAASILSGMLFVSALVLFLRGAWKGGKGFTIDEIDLSKLPGNFGGVKHDDNSDANARQEGFI